MSEEKVEDCGGCGLRYPVSDRFQDLVCVRAGDVARSQVGSPTSEGDVARGVDVEGRHTHGAIASRGRKGSRPLPVDGRSGSPGLIQGGSVLSEGLLGNA